MIVFRTDASADIGLGHFSRCLAFASAFSCTATWASVGLPVALQKGLQKAGHLYIEIPAGLSPEEDANFVFSHLAETPHLVVLDHYKLGLEWETLVPGKTALFIFEDEPSRPHDGAFLLDQNRGTDANIYRDWVPPSCRCLIGLSFCMIRSEVVAVRNARDRQGDCKNILVNFGGAGWHSEIEKALDAIQQWGRSDFQVRVVFGGDFNQNQAIRNQFSAPWISYIDRVDHMADHWAWADLALGAGGVSSLERCCVGLPALVTVLADNQAPLVGVLAAGGAQINLGRQSSVNAETYLQALKGLSRSTLLEMSDCGRNLVDGLGARRVVEIVNKQLQTSKV
ncbi:MAG: UDP-2,4-diacetamido-2,4,6-trideoxy-beta-L-altropyranose hydrolase [Candidatus Marinamargulisbacteria bacterium]|jgi:UDP-2,4-diacetamido-2,4,6-trideoxy-beta-L-altropyranose hydrolase